LKPRTETRRESMWIVSTRRKKISRKLITAFRSFRFVFKLPNQKWLGSLSRLFGRVKPLIVTYRPEGIASWRQSGAHSSSPRSKDLTSSDCTPSHHHLTPPLDDRSQSGVKIRRHFTQNLLASCTSFDRLIKLKSTLFVLPLTLSGALLGFVTTDPVGDMWRWLAIIFGFTCARTAGMAFNEWIDKEIDAKNARTLDRVLPRGEMAVWQVALIAWTSLALFVLVAYSLGKTLFIASLILATLIALYSYTKRVTSLCHFILGAILGAGPVMAYLAMTGTINPLALLLGLATFCSLTACDIVYAVQDYPFDRIEGLHSVPALLGVPRSKRLAALLHGISAILLILLGVKSPMGLLYYLGIACLIASLIRFHYLVLRKVHSVNTPLFFRCNAVFANLTFLSIIGGLLWPM